VEKEILVGPHVDEPEVFVRQSLDRSFWHCRRFLKSDFPRRAGVSSSFRLPVAQTDPGRSLRRYIINDVFGCFLATTGRDQSLRRGDGADD